MAASIELLSVLHAAKVLDCSDDMVYDLIARGDLRAVDIAPSGSLRPKTRIRSDDLDDYINRKTRTAKAAS